MVVSYLPYANVWHLPQAKVTCFKSAAARYLTHNSTTVMAEKSLKKNLRLVDCQIAMAISYARAIRYSSATRDVFVEKSRECYYFFLPLLQFSVSNRLIYNKTITRSRVQHDYTLHLVRFILLWKNKLGMKYRTYRSTYTSLRYYVSSFWKSKNKNDVDVIFQNIFSRKRKKKTLEISLFPRRTGKETQSGIFQTKCTLIFCISTWYTSAE